MNRGFLVDRASGRRVAVKLPVTIGRTRDCEFVIDDGAASRRHVEVAPRDNTFHWKDLGSTNGTILNGRPMLAGELKHGDEIQIGDTYIQFVVETDGRAVESAGTTGEFGLFRETVYDARGEEQQVDSDSKSVKLLETIYAVANEIAANYDPNALMERVLTLVMQAIDAQRGAIFLTNDNGDLDTSPVSVRLAGRSSQGGSIHISQTVASKVLREGRSVLFKQSDTDSEIDTSASIMALELRSILCVPLRAKDNILGILYIDTDRAGQEYSEDHVLLAAAVGNSAGLAIENARMHREILEKQRIEHDIETAWTIQEGFLVRDWPEEEKQFQVYGETRPARVVGGDFYDFVRPASNKVGLLIGDVSGKGVPASLLMAQLLAEFRMLVRIKDSPAEIVSRLNEELAKRSRRGMFCTLCYLSLDLETGEVRSANAGHHSAMLIAKSGISQFCSASGPPAGVLPVGDWEECRTKLQPGETILLYTDGIVEAHGMGTLHEQPSTPAPMTQYEFNNLSDVARAHHNQTPQVLLEAIFNDVLRFCAPDSPHDDCTMIAVRYLGQAK